MGGRIAEEQFMHHVTTGAGNDIERATDLARKMVCEWGMSDLGPMSFGKKEEQIFLGREIAQHRDYSEDTAIKIDQQVRGLVDMGYQRAKQIIEERREAMVRIAEALLEREVLEAAEVKQLIDGQPLSPRTTPKNSDDNKSQQVIRPDQGSPVRVPGLTEGHGPAPA
jgi:cell division protease FtsH